MRATAFALTLATSAVLATPHPTPASLYGRERDIIAYEIPQSCMEACKPYLVDIQECPEPVADPMHKCALCEPNRVKHQFECTQCFAPNKNLSPHNPTIANWTSMCLSAAQAVISQAYAAVPSMAAAANATTNETISNGTTATATGTTRNGAASLVIPLGSVAVALTLAFGLVA